MRLMMPDYPWDRVEASKRFIENLFNGPPPARPAAIFHYPEANRAQPEAVPGGDPALEPIRGELARLAARPVGEDDFVPAVSTGGSTCAMATAFGAEEIRYETAHAVKPVVARAEEIDRLRPPPVAAGVLGGVLARTRLLAERLDPRVFIRIMDFQAPFTVVEQLVGSELFFLMPYDHPRRLHAAMDIVTDFCIAFFKEQMEAAGPSCCPGSWPAIWFPRSAGIQMSDDNLVNVSPDIYEEFVVPYNNRIAAAFGGLFLHSCTIREAHLGVLGKLKGLTGVNCDISTSVSPKRQMDAFGDGVVVAPHAYINTDTNFPDYAAFTEYVLRGWRPGRRLFIHPCSVLYLPDRAREIAFAKREVQEVLNRIPAWRRDHGQTGCPR